MKSLKKFFVFLLFFIFFSFFAKKTSSQVCQSVEDCQKIISESEQKIKELSSQRNTLSSQIQYMDTQIYLTESKISQTEIKINQTEEEINQIEKRINGLDQSIDYLANLLVKRLVLGYKNRSLSLLNLLFESENIPLFINQYKYWKSAQEENQRLLVKTQQSKLNLEEQKSLREEKITELDNLQKELTRQKAELAQQKLAKQKLLIETQNSEERYQELVSQAKSQLSAFTRFVESQGGASILQNQTQCDDWGCYYNQRDAQWGNYIINNSYDCNGACTVARVGCLITSVAMVTTHLGFRDINPLSIAVDQGNFYLNTALLNWNIQANGKNVSLINATLSPEAVKNGPLIVGVRYGEFGSHFVVVKDYRDGNYIINDPFTPNGKDLVFTEKYSLSSIFQVNRVVVN